MNIEGFDDYVKLKINLKGKNNTYLYTHYIYT